MTKTNEAQTGGVTMPVTDIAEGINPFAAPAIAQEQNTEEIPAAVATTEPPATTTTPTTEVVNQEVTTTPTQETPAETKVETPVPPAFTFDNEYSEKIFSYLKEGKTDELLQYLSEQKTLASVESMEAEAAIKLRLQYDNPDYTEDEIQGLFEEQFARPEKPEQAIDELDEEYEARVGKWDKKNKAFDNKLARERKSALKVLAAKKSELILPDIKANVPVTPEPTAEQIAQQAKEQQLAVQAYHQTIEKGLAEFNGYTTEVEFDKGVKLPISFTVDASEKPAFQQTLQQFDVNEYFGKRWIGEDGAFNGKQFADDVFWITNKELIAKRMASEGANRRLEEYLKVKNNVDFSGGRQQPIQQHTDEADKMASYFFGIR